MGGKSSRIFSQIDGYSVGDFLHYGFDNLDAAELLLKNNARYFDSAGYLAHLGVEHLLKAWHLHSFGQFKEGHSLKNLWSTLQQHDTTLQLDSEAYETLRRIDTYFSLRYPNPAQSQEIGDDDLPAILRLEPAICSQMPPAMHHVMNALSGVRKGGRLLMEKPIDD